MLCILSFFINAPIDKLRVGFLYKRTTSALALCFMAEPAFLIVEVLVTLSAFDFTPQEDTHDGTYGCPVLNALQNRVELGCGSNGNYSQSIGDNDTAGYC